MYVRSRYLLQELSGFCFPRVYLGRDFTRVRVAFTPAAYRSLDFNVLQELIVVYLVLWLLRMTRTLNPLNFC